MSISDVFEGFIEPIVTDPSIVPLQPELVEVFAIESVENWANTALSMKVHTKRAISFIRNIFLYRRISF